MSNQNDQIRQEALEEIENAVQPRILEELETPDAFIVIPMDSMLIQQVLMNLLENAALHAEGKIGRAHV